MKSPRSRSAQRGAVLIVSLIMLVILTILGVTGMTTSSLEEKMAANSQESYRAFQAAEVGIGAAYNQSGTFGLGPTSTPPTTIGASGMSFETATRFEGFSRPPPSSAPSSSESGALQFAHFETRSTGTTSSGARVITFAGTRQLAPGQ